MNLVIWILALVVLALWTATAWAVHALLSVDPSWVGDLAPLLDKVPFAGWLDAYLPGWDVVLSGSLSVAQSLLSAAGGIGLWIVWVLWALVAFVIVAGAVLLSVIVMLVRKASSGTGGAGGAGGPGGGFKPGSSPTPTA
ncbi:MAG: hypothetical protein ACOVOT_02670 [Rubrivivax sp.]|jgi:hypothetical protein|nr:hypothetical protein [Rubrivivax sp.]